MVKLARYLGKHCLATWSEQFDPQQRAENALNAVIDKLTKKTMCGSQQGIPQVIQADKIKEIMALNAASQVADLINGITSASQLKQMTLAIKLLKFSTCTLRIQ